MNLNKTAVLLINLGTPDSYSQKSVKQYLKEFLLDKRVIDSSWLKRQFLVRCFIIPKKYRESASSYQRIWTSEGSPLLMHGKTIQQLLQEKLGDAYQVELAMRYKHPSIDQALEKVKNLKQIIILPLFPQYASATTGTIHEKIMNSVARWNIIPEMTFINSFPDQKQMIDAFCDLTQYENIANYDHLLISFHGLPKRHLLKADCHQYCLKEKNCCEKICNKNIHCYASQCYRTASAIITSLNIPSDFYTICFQSRLGKDPWLEPYVSDVLKKLAIEGKKRVLVICPSFISDCIETIHEISIEYDKEFKKYGGEKLQLVKGLNDHPLWIEALYNLVKERSHC